MKKELELKNDVSQVPLLGEWVEVLGKEWGLPMSAVFQLNLALEEAVVNVMSYAYPGERDKPIWLVAVYDNDGSGISEITFTLKDNGIPFDPTEADEPDVTLSAEERNIGGLGIFLVQQMMSSVEYKRTDTQNVLTMVYKITNN